MQKDLLVLTWLNGHAQFISVSAGRVVSSWESAERVDLVDPSANMVDFFQAARSRTRYAGKNLAIVLAHPQLTQQLLETPPAKGRDLELFIERQVDQLKICEGEVAWSFQKTHPIKDSSGLVLYLLPKVYCDRLIHAAQRSGLHLVGLVAPSALLSRQVAQLPLEGDGIALLLAETRGTTSIVAARKDGTIFLARSLHCSWDKDPERIASQINRSTVFLRQQFGFDVSQIVLFGKGSKALTVVMQEKVELPVTLYDEEVAPAHWVKHLMESLAEDTSANLISREQQQAPHRRVMVALTAGLLTLLSVVSVTVALWIEWQVRTEIGQLANLQPKLTDLQMRKVDLDERLEKLAAQEQLTAFITGQQLPPAPGLFLTYLADVLPDELLLTKLEVKRLDRLSGEKDAPEDGWWSVRLEGGVSWDASGETASSEVQAAYLALSNELTDGPFHLSITERTRQFAPPREKPGWAVSNRSGADQFFIEGLMRGGSIQ